MWQQLSAVELQQMLACGVQQSKEGDIPFMRKVDAAVLPAGDKRRWKGDDRSSSPCYRHFFLIYRKR